MDVSVSVSASSRFDIGSRIGISMRRISSYTCTCTCTRACACTCIAVSRGLVGRRGNLRAELAASGTPDSSPRRRDTRHKRAVEGMAKHDSLPACVCASHREQPQFPSRMRCG